MTHKKELAGIMPIASMDWCREKRLPFLFVGLRDADKQLKAIHCLHCGDYNTTPYGMGAMKTTATIKHKDCIAKFKDYEEYYQTSAIDEEFLNTLLDEPIATTALSSAELDALKSENECLKAENAKLKADYDELDTRFNHYLDKESDHDVDKFKAADNVVNKVTDVLLRQIAYKLPDRMKAELLPYIKEVEAAIDAYEDN